MSHTAYVGILISIFIFFMMTFVITGIIFSEYCSTVAAAEGRLEELLDDSIGSDDWGAYRTELFRRLYKRENCEGGNIFLLRGRAKLGFSTLLILVFSFFVVLYCAKII